jgi:hypothetical protein
MSPYPQVVCGCGDIVPLINIDKGLCPDCRKEAIDVPA